MKKVLFAAAAFVAFATNVSAQSSPTATQAVNLNMANVIELSINGATTTGAAVTLPFTSASDYATGVASAAQELKVRSNKNFKIDVKTDATNFSFTPTGGTTTASNMPVQNILKLMVAAAPSGGSGAVSSSFSTSAYNTLTASNQPLFENCQYGDNRTYSVKYQATPGFNYPGGGTYTVNVVYTATQQ